jgi:RES domain-containing protein
VTPLPPPLNTTSNLTGWRIDQAQFAPTWDSGVGARDYPGRWNAKMVEAVYASLDPATAILEVAVHKGFNILDTRPYMITRFEIIDPSAIHVVYPDAVPNPAWLESGIPKLAQQHYGSDLLRVHPFVVLPSVVSRASWNILFSPSAALGKYIKIEQKRLVIDPRLHH